MKKKKVNSKAREEKQQHDIPNYSSVDTFNNTSAYHKVNLIKDKVIEDKIIENKQVKANKDAKKNFYENKITGKLQIDIRNGESKDE